MDEKKQFLIIIGIIIFIIIIVKFMNKESGGIMNIKQSALEPNTGDNHVVVSDKNGNIRTSNALYITSAGDKYIINKTTDNTPQVPTVEINGDVKLPGNLTVTGSIYNEWLAKQLGSLQLKIDELTKTVNEIQNHAIRDDKPYAIYNAWNGVLNAKGLSAEGSQAQFAGQSWPSTDIIRITKRPYNLSGDIQDAIKNMTDNGIKPW